MRKFAIGAAAIALSACQSTAVPIVQGPLPEAIVTPYESALICLQNEMTASGKEPIFAGVGAIKDMSGKFNTDDGTGYFAPQGPDHILTAAMSDTGLFKMVERVDMSVADVETKLAADKLLGDGKKYTVPGANGTQTQIDYIPLMAGSVQATDYYVAGAITHIDFGTYSGGGDLRVLNIGPRFRAFYGIVGWDVRLVNTRTRNVAASKSYIKQIYGDSAGFGLGRIFGTTLVSADIGRERREPIGLAVRYLAMRSALELAADAYGLDAKKCLEPMDETEAEMQIRSLQVQYIQHNTGAGNPENPDNPVNPDNS